MQETWTQTLGYGSRNAYKHERRPLDTVVTTYCDRHRPQDTVAKVRQTQTRTLEYGNKTAYKHRYGPRDTVANMHRSIDTDPWIR